MRYFKIEVLNGYCGCDSTEYFEVEDNVTEDWLNETTEQLAQENAESYEYCHIGWDTEHMEEEELQEMLADYYENNIEGYWKEISKEEYLENGGR